MINKTNQNAEKTTKESKWIVQIEDVKYTVRGVDEADAITKALEVLRNVSGGCDGYPGVSNIKIITNQDGTWLEFDFESEPRSRHKMMIAGAITEYTSAIDE